MLRRETGFCSKVFSSHGRFYREMKLIFIWRRQSIHKTAEYGLQTHQMLNTKYLSTLQKSLCGLALLQVSFLVLIFLRVMANKPCNVFGYCTKLPAYVANIRGSSTAAKTVPLWNTFYANWNLAPYWASNITVRTTFHRW